ncbi:glycosyltransferase [Dactylosporangium sp. NPDC049140]|jgi:UDP-N-acetylglucosamine:LPS N-acetylglucosamine transferase|uniref:MGDG synthase family glycosyltransferase n=1 Tax=Dactylosporangium sp. NPDC049140 TaxID=3155647 RepID=UPI0033FDACA0
MNQRIVVVSASFGAGHDGVATELTRRLTARGRRVERHDFVDLVPGRLGRVLRAGYHRQLTAAPRTWGWLLAAAGAGAGTAARLTALADQALLDAIGPGTAAVVSTYPLASQALGRLRAQGRIAAPVCTYLTDLSVHPLWIHPGVDVHIGLHDDAARQAKELGAADVRVTAPAVGPGFRAAPRPDGTGDPRALIVAGAWGVGSIERAAADVAATGAAVPVVVCGRNDRLRRRVERQGDAVTLGWVDDMPALMRGCDVVVQNAGGLSSLEALTAGLPVLTYRCIPGHGRTNAEVLDRIGWVPWIRDRAGLAGGLRRAMTGPPRFDPAPARAEDVILELAG